MKQKIELIMSIVLLLSVLVVNDCIAQVQMFRCEHDTCRSLTTKFNRTAIKVGKSSIFEELKDSRCGYVDATGKLVIPLLYNKVSDFGDDGIAVVLLLNPSKKPSYYSWHIKVDGTPLYSNPKRYCDARPYYNGYAIVDVDGSYHMCHINKKGDRIYTQTYPWAYDFTPRGRAVVIKTIKLSTDKALYVVIDTKGKELISAWGKYSSGEFPKIIEDYMNKN